MEIRYVDIRAKKSNLEKFAVSFSLYISGMDMTRTKHGFFICLVLLK